MNWYFIANTVSYRQDSYWCRHPNNTTYFAVGSCRHHNSAFGSHFTWEQGWSEFWPGGFNHPVKTGLNHLIKPTKTGQKWSKLTFWDFSWIILWKMVRNGTIIYKSAVFGLDKFMLDLLFGKLDREGNIPMISAILYQLSIIDFQLKKWLLLHK